MRFEWGLSDETHTHTHVQIIKQTHADRAKSETKLALRKYLVIIIEVLRAYTCSRIRYRSNAYSHTCA